MKNLINSIITVLFLLSFIWSVVSYFNFRVFAHEFDPNALVLFLVSTLAFIIVGYHGYRIEKAKEKELNKEAFILAKCIFEAEKKYFEAQKQSFEDSTTDDTDGLI